MDLWLLISIILTILTMMVMVISWLIYRVSLRFEIKVRTDKPSLDTICLAYKFYQGDYSQAYLAFKELYSIIGSRKNVKVVGIFYDDPLEVQSGKQRYALGIVLNDAQLTVDEPLESLMLKNKFNIVWITRINYAVVAQYSCWRFFSLLLPSAPQRVYPELKKFIKRQKLCAYPYIEFYYGNTTEYIVPLCEQEKFFLPEYYAYDANDVYYKNRQRKKSSNESQSQVKTKTAQDPALIKDSKVFIKNSSSSSSTGKKRR
jgi:hypothetical protein